MGQGDIIALLNGLPSQLSSLIGGNPGIVDHGQAAETLQYAQSTVSAHIQALEKELGFPLFERIGRKNCLTREGQEFLEQTSQLQTALQRISSIGQKSNNTGAVLRVGVLESLLFDSLMDVIPTFSKEYPNIPLSLRVGNSTELLEMLRQNQVDIIYIALPPIAISPFLRLHMKQINLAFLAGSGHPLAHHKHISLEEILQYPFVLSGLTGQCYEIFHNLAASVNISPRCMVTVNNNQAISAFLQDNHSISFLPYTAVSYLKKVSNSATLDVDIHRQTYFSQVLVRKGTWLSPAMDYLVSLIKARD